MDSVCKKVDAISSLAVGSVCIFVCVELKVRERRGKHHHTCQSDHDRVRRGGRDALITLKNGGKTGKCPIQKTREGETQRSRNHSDNK